MHHPERHLRTLRRLLGGAGLGTALVVAGLVPVGCQPEKPKENVALKIRYTDLGPKEDVPEFMKGTVWEITNRTNDEAYASATYGLVGRLRGTGDSTASLPVRQWMVKQMARHGYGSKLLPGYSDVGAEQVLRNPNYAIARVDGLLPPGAREGDFFDVRVTALPGNKTSSLSGGVLFESDLHKVRGNTPDLEGIEALAKARGPIVVNPAYALADVSASSAQARASLRSGVVMDGGRVMRDRPLVLRLRQPARPIARAIENRINQRFQKVADRARKDVMPVTYQVAAALDEGLVEVYIPRAYRGDWEHFLGVVEHMYLSPSPATAVARAKDLADEAVKPGAWLLDVSYGLEAIGEPALQYVLPLMVHPNPDVAFAMARAAVFIGDDSGAAQDALLRMAKSDSHPFQLDAIQTLGALTASAERNQKIREVLDVKNTLARTEAYKVLVRNRDSGIYTRWIGDPRDKRPQGERDEKFALDLVPAAGEPIIYASRSGIPRIALIGPKPSLKLPVLFTALDSRLMISSPSVGKTVTLFFRDDARKEPLKMISRPDVAELVARLGGEGAPEEDKFDFTYGEIVAILSTMAQEHKITASRPDGQVTLAPFVFERPRQSQDAIESAPVIEDTRPNTGGAATDIEPVLPRKEASTTALKQ